MSEFINGLKNFCLYVTRGVNTLTRDRGILNLYSSVYTRMKRWISVIRINIGYVQNIGVVYKIWFKGNLSFFLLFPFFFALLLRKGNCVNITTSTSTICCIWISFQNKLVSNNRQVGKKKDRYSATWNIFIFELISLNM